MPKDNEKMIYKRIITSTIIISFLVGGVVGGLAGMLTVSNFELVKTLFGFDFFISDIEKTVHIEIESAITEVVEKASPAVVSIIVTKDLPKIEQFYINPFGDDPFFREFFGDDFLIPQQRQEGFEKREVGGGTGFIVTSDGLIVTNKHVVAETGATYKVITKDNKEYKVVQISRDPANDVAILKIDPSPLDGEGLKPVELGDSSNLKVGQFVIAIGTALGEFRHTVTTGVISGLGRGITAGSIFEGYVEELDNIIQTDAAINPGNSGGPLLNSVGQVIGVNVALAQGAQNIGFALPINTVKDSLNQFKSSGGFAKKAYLGVQYQMISQQTAIMNNVPQGAYVVEVVADSPAEKAGIKTDDIITKLDGQEITDKNGGLAKAIVKKKPGDTISLDLWRDLPAGGQGGETLTLQVTLSEFGE